MKLLNSKLLPISEITSDSLINLACTDLGAFRKIGQNNFKNHKISGIVIMEDRVPDFFVLYNKFEANKDTTLNRHGPGKELFNQKHLQELVKELHSQNIKVYLGFWGQLFNPHQSQRLDWLVNHAELWTLNHDHPQNTDLDPLVILQPENISFADFVVRQFSKFKKDYNFDGLFLGDGLNGYRLFVNPNHHRDKQHTKERWTNFYQTIATGLHNLNCQLLSYDCLGLPPDEAILHGADYLAQAQAGLDYLIVQTYPVAWGKKWLKNHPGFKFKSTLEHLHLTFEQLKNTDCRVIYTLEMGDRIEGWRAKKRLSRKQLKHYQPFADGKLLVWANELFYELLK